MSPIDLEISHRPPVVAIMGHIDHGKSTLLDFIRKSNVVEGEAGGITQRVSAYEVIHKDASGKESRITFLDTPGHEAFGGIRARGALVADIAVLVVSAEDGVKAQTLDAFNAIRKAELPYIVAINKIDKPGADIERTKKTLAENEIYVEGYGGNIPWNAISAKTGEGVSDLLDTIVLVAEFEELEADPEKHAEGIVIESSLDPKQGISATLIIKDGTISMGQYVVAGESMAPVRIMQDFAGKPIKEATVSSPVRIIGFTSVPPAGSTFRTVAHKKEADDAAEKAKVAAKLAPKAAEADDLEGKAIIPVIIKSDAIGSLEAIAHEIAKFPREKIIVKTILSGIGPILENDIKTAAGAPGSIVFGFSVKADKQAESLALRLGVAVETYDIIYKLIERLQKLVEERTPKMMVDNQIGKAKILKVFSKAKDRQIIGGKVEIGEIRINTQVKIVRREAEIGRGFIRELQQQKEKTSSVIEGLEFGSMVVSPVEIAPGDRLECFEAIEK